MEIIFKDAANGQKTCSVKSFHIHSSYNPDREAEKFVNTLQYSFNPKYILITEPGLSYSSTFFRKKFPTAIMCCVRYCHDFDNKNSCWDKIFYATEDSENLGEQLFSFLGDEGVATCLFTSWIPSQAPFEKEYKYCWNEIKNAVLKSRNVLATRNYFAKRWLKNSIKLSLYAESNYTIKNGNFPVVVCASGPSLLSSIEYIKKFRNNFFLIAVSSALAPLLKNSITPDLCISTDGGYWAKKHISFGMKNTNIPLALASEGSCFSRIIENSKIIPLSYMDSPADEIIKFCDLKFLKAFRNGTVSGTAANLALGITTGPVFFCGLDLASSKNFQHTQPNELEIENARFDNRFSNTETRLFPSTLPSPSLDIYKNWFAATDFKNRLYRLSNNFVFLNSLGKVKDINWEAFKELTESYGNKKCDIEIHKLSFIKQNNKNKISDLIYNNKDNLKWQKDLVPAQALIYERSLGLDTEADAKAQLTQEIDNFINNLNSFFSGGTL